MLALHDGIPTSSLIRRILIGTLLGAFVISVGSFYFLLRQRALDSAYKEAKLLLTTAMSVSGFTEDNLFPLLNELPHDAFYKQVVPFYAAHVTFERLQTQYPNYTFRQTALNPTNPADRPTPHEVDLINRFREDPKLQMLQGTRQDGPRSLFYVAQPLKVANAQCLVCHSTPPRAPATMVAAYGPSNGFNWNLGETVGAMELSVPITDELRGTIELLAILAGGLLALFSVLYVALTVSLSAALVRPLQKLALRTDAASVATDAAGDWPQSGTREFKQLSEAVARLDTSLRKALDRVNRRTLHRPLDQKH